MHKCRFGEILENAVRLCGRDVTLNAVPDDWKVLAAMTINSGIRSLAAEKFPMMMRIESRRYRPTWDEASSYAVGNEVWCDGDYWRYDEVGTGRPGTDGSGWTKLDMRDLPAFVSFEQPWENTVIDRGGIDIDAFAFERSPLYYPKATPLKVVGLSSFGIELQAPAPKEVYVRFVPLYPRIAFNEWTAGEYDAGTVVYRTASKDVYVAIKDVPADKASVVPGSDEDEIWESIRICDEFSSYLTRLVAADLQTEAQGKFQTRAQADSEFNDLCERYHEGTGENRVKRGRFY